MKKLFFALIIIFGFLFFVDVSLAAPLTVHPTNHRYFTDDSGKVIYLTGSHTWATLSDYSPASPLDFDAFLNLLTNNGHNFTRLWAYYGNDGASPVPWTKTNGKYNLNVLNQAYFDRLRARVIAARDRGIYTGIILFRPDNAKLGDGDWGVDPFNGVDSYDSYNNNNNNLNGDTNNDGRGWEAYDGSISGILDVQQSYVRKVIDTTYDLDNVIYEIANEAPSITANKQWQYSMIDYIKNYELTTYGKNHPVWMSAIFSAPGENWTPDNSFITDLNCHADVVSPGTSSYKDNPPQNAGAKPIIADIDHIWPDEPQPAWIWKAFTRSLMPIHMDSFTYFSNPGGGISDQDQIDIRKYMGQTLTYVDKMNLAAMSPSTSAASTGYALVNTGQEYLAYQPSSGSFTVNLTAGNYSYEWFRPSTGSIYSAGSITASGGNQNFTPPFSGDAVLYLKSGGAPEPYCGDTYCNGTETCSACPSDCGVCPSTNPIAWWKFDETSGTTASDSSGNSNTGTLINGPVWTTGKRNRALSFDGVNDYVNIQSGHLISTDNWTASFWIYPHTLGTTDVWPQILVNGDDISGGGVSGMVFFIRSTTGKARATIVVGTESEESVDSLATPTVNSWQHVSVIKNGTALKLYFNGIEEGSITLSSSVMDYTANAPQTRIGTRSDALQFFDGLIDEVRVYNRALSASEIQTLYNVGTDTTPPAAPTGLAVI